jgi:hypothetical protein
MTTEGPTQEMVTTDAPLGGDGSHVEGVEPRPGDATRGNALAPVPQGWGRAWTWMSAALVLACLGA